MTWQFLAAGLLSLAGFVLTWLIQSTVLLAVGLLAGRLLRKRGPAVQSALYRTTLGAVMLCPVASMAMAAMGFSGLLIDGHQASSQPVEALSAQTSQTRVSTMLPAIVPDPASETSAVLPMVASVPLPDPSGIVPRLIGWVSVPIVAAWLLGAAALGMRLLVGHRRMARLRSSAIDAEPDVHVLCRDLARRMRLEPPSVLRSPFLCSPCLDGLRRPAILLPEDAAEHLRETFIHELAHLERRDGLWNLLRHIATAVFWMQPLLWLLSKRLEATAEEVCDDYVVEFGADRCRYAGHLLELAERRMPPLAPSGVGMISLRSLLSRRIARILDSTRTLSIQAGRRAIAATMLAGLAGTLLVGLVGVGGRDRLVLGDEPKAALKVPTGTPVKEPEKPDNARSEQGKVATHMMPISGRIVDLEGRPVAGASVQVAQITKPKGDNLDLWIEAVKRGEPQWIAYEHLNYEPPIAPESKRPRATTDTQGRFHFEGLEAERVVNIVIQGSTISYTSLDVVTRRIEPILAKGSSSWYGSEAVRIYGNDFTYTAAPGRPVEGVVRDARTKLPLAGVKLVSEQFAGSAMSSVKSLETTTDGQGRFRLVGFPKGSGNAITVVPNDDQPYFMQDVAIPDPPGIAPVPVEISLHQGIWIRGKVTEKETGKPVEGVWLHYIPFLENTFAQATPEFGKDRNVDGVSVEDRYQSKADGSYRLVGLPGRAIVGAASHSPTPYLKGAGSESIKGMDGRGHFPTYFNPVWAGRYFPSTMKEINPPDGVDVVNLDLELVAGGKVVVRVVDALGKPVAGVLAAGRTGRDGRDREPRKGADFEVECLAPDEDRLVIIIQEERELGKVFHVKLRDDKDGPVAIALEPLASLTGRLVDVDGNPVSGATIRTDPAPWSPGGSHIHLSHVATDREGRFVVPRVPAGCKYILVAEIGNRPRDRRVAFVQDVSVRPGETSNVGDIRFKND